MSTKGSEISKRPSAMKNFPGIDLRVMQEASAYASTVGIDVAVYENGRGKFLYLPADQKPPPGWRLYWTAYFLPN